MMKHLKSIIPSVLIALLVAGGANAALWQWSKTAATNATADPSVNWAEGMSPSSVNDSARAMMARTAEWRDDLSGLLLTGGTSTAYTVTTNQGLASVPNDGQALALTVHTDSGLAPTLRADGGTIYPIQSAAGTAIGAGVLVSGAPYTVKFKLASNAWVLHSFYGQPFVVPIGGMIDYFGTTPPNSNFAFPFGQCISRTTYAALFALISTTYNGCDGTTTFGLPDLRGQLTAGRDDMGGSARNFITVGGSSCSGVTLGVNCGAQNVVLVTANLAAHTHNGTSDSASNDHTHSGTTAAETQGHVHSGTTGDDSPDHTHSLDSLLKLGGPTAVRSDLASNTLTSVSMTGGASTRHQHPFTSGTQSATHNHTFTSGGQSANHTHTFTTGSTGSGTAVNKLPPVQIVNKLMRIF